MPKSKPAARTLFEEAPEHYFQCGHCDKVYRHQLGIKIHRKICPFLKQLSKKSLDEASFQCLCRNPEFNNHIQVKKHILNSFPSEKITLEIV